MEKTEPQYEVVTVRDVDIHCQGGHHIETTLDPTDFLEVNSDPNSTPTPYIYIMRKRPDFEEKQTIFLRDVQWYRVMTRQRRRVVEFTPKVESEGGTKLVGD